jgi:WD40 repeat protein
MLVSMSPDQIKLMEIDTGDVIQRFEAHMQKQFIIRSAFGGADENFVVSGSEGLSSTPHGLLRVNLSNWRMLDSRIYIWRSNGLLIEALDAHPGGCVNAVAWHPKDPSTFASAGDDMRVKIWKPTSTPPMPSGSGSSNGHGR